MKDFIFTGQYWPTLTTVDDPELLVEECDNGVNWSLNFYCGRTLIDRVDLEHVYSSLIDEIDHNVLQLNVFDAHENHFVGNVKDVIQHALRYK